MTIKSRYTRDELTQTISDPVSAIRCSLCEAWNYADIEHDVSCPLADDSVMAITIAVSPEGTRAICGGCSRDAQECPACMQFGGVELCTHARLKDICERYRVADICRTCRRAIDECPMGFGHGFTKTHAELMAECDWYADKVIC